MAAVSTFTQVITSIQMMNMEVLDKFFGGISQAQFFKTKEIKWDLVDIKNTPAEYHSLTQKAQIIGKDGFKRLTMTPPTINNGIIRDSESSRGLKAGELEITRGGVNDGLDANAVRQLESAIIHLRQYKTRLNVQAGQALSVGGIEVNDGSTLFYNVPAGNKYTFNWALTTTSRLADLNSMVDGMEIPPTEFIFGKDTFTSFMKGDDVREGNDSSGKGQNFQRATVSAAQRESRYFLVGTVTLDSGDFDIYVWNDVYTNSAGVVTNYFPKTALTATTAGMGGMAYGGLNRLNGKSVEWFAAEFLAEEGIITSDSNDNPEVKDIFKSAPAVIIPDGNKIAFATVTVA